MEALRDATNKAPRVTACGHHLCGDCAELWFATETKCPVCSAKCVGVPGGLQDIKAPVTKDVAPPEEPTRATTPAVREEAVYTPVEDDLVLNEEPVVDGPTYAATEPEAAPTVPVELESLRPPPDDDAPAPERLDIEPSRCPPTPPGVSSSMIDDSVAVSGDVVGRLDRAGNRTPDLTVPSSVDDLLAQLSTRWRGVSAENGRLRSDVDRLEEECGYLHEALRAARAENDALRGGSGTVKPASRVERGSSRVERPAAPEPVGLIATADPLAPTADPLATAAVRVEEAVSGLWRSRGDPRSPKPPTHISDTTSHRDPVHAVATKPDPNRHSSFTCVTASWDGIAKVHSVTRGDGIAVIRTDATCAGHATGLYACEFSPTAPGLFGTVSGDGTCRLWTDLDRGEYRCVGVLEGHNDEVNGLAFAPSTPLLATASDDGTAAVWDVSSGVQGGRYAPVATCSGHTSEVYGVGWSCDDVLATVSFDRTCKLWDVRGDGGRGVKGASCVRTLAGHRDDVVGVSFHPNDKHVLATGSDDGTVCVWDLRGTSDGGKLVTLRLHGGKETKRVSFSPGGAMLASGGADGMCAIVDTAHWTQIATLSGHTDTVFDVAWAPDGKSVVTASHDASWRVWTV